MQSKDDSLILLISLLINVIHKKNICEELLSRARIAPAKFLSYDISSDNLLSEIMNNVRVSMKKSKGEESYLEGSNFPDRKGNKIEASVGI